jgi:hypothetical protein
MRMGRTSSRIPASQLTASRKRDSLHRIHRSLAPLKLGWIVSTHIEARGGNINSLIKPRITECQLHIHPLFKYNSQLVNDTLKPDNRKQSTPDSSSTNQSQDHKPQ